ncbi:Rha family transcriptional regulator [Mediterraneibacter gnavus]|uniref:Rha family transcriptional regulator n=1 Tax=Mediterraneibacter gnavus TaxID=33038 RepID=UPI00356517EB
MVERRHDHLIRDIKGYVKHLTDANFGVSEYFIESEYKGSTGRTLPCYLCTKKGKVSFSQLHILKHSRR